MELSSYSIRAGLNSCTTSAEFSSCNRDYLPSGHLQEQFADSRSIALLDLLDYMTQVAKLFVLQSTSAAEPFLLWAPLETGSLVSHMINESEQAL